MKKIALASLILSSSFVFSQNELALYNFNGTGAETCPNRIVAPQSPVANLTFGNFVAANVTCIQTANQFNNDGWNTSATIDLTEYVEFSITANSGFKFTLDSLKFDLRSSQLGGIFHLRSSLDNYANDISGVEMWDGAIYQPGVSSIAIPDSYFTFRKIFTASYANLSTVTFRFYATNVSAGTTTIRLDNVIPHGSVNASGTGVNELKNELSAIVSPNPGEDQLNINFKETQENLKVKIYSVSGKLMNEITYKNINTCKVNTNNLSEGIYFIQIENGLNSSSYRWIKK